MCIKQEEGMLVMDQEKYIVEIEIAELKKVIDERSLVPVTEYGSLAGKFN